MQAHPGMLLKTKEREGVRCQVSGIRCIEAGMVEGHYSGILAPTFCLLNCKDEGASGDVAENKREDKRCQMSGPRSEVAGFRWRASGRPGAALDWRGSFLPTVYHLPIPKNAGSSGYIYENKGWGKSQVAKFQGLGLRRAPDLMFSSLFS